MVSLAKRVKYYNGLYGWNETKEEVDNYFLPYVNLIINYSESLENDYVKCVYKGSSFIDSEDEHIYVDKTREMVGIPENNVEVRERYKLQKKKLEKDLKINQIRSILSVTEQIVFDTVIINYFNDNDLADALNMNKSNIYDIKKMTYYKITEYLGLPSLRVRGYRKI